MFLVLNECKSIQYFEAACISKFLATLLCIHTISFRYYIRKCKILKHHIMNLKLDQKFGIFIACRVLYVKHYDIWFDQANKEIKKTKFDLLLPDPTLNRDNVSTKNVKFF